jgi:hypothetical protein
MPAFVVDHMKSALEARGPMNTLPHLRHRWLGGWTQLDDIDCGVAMMPVLNRGERMTAIRLMVLAAAGLALAG